MNPSQIPEKPLYAGVNTKLDPLKTVYFFEKEDGTFINASGADAWQIYSNKQRFIGRPNDRMKLVGTSDGKTYQKAVLEAHQIFKTSGLPAAQDRLRKGFLEELEEARKHVVPPPNYDIVDFRGNPTSMPR